MKNLADLLKTWSPVLVPLLTLLAGAGWFQYFLNRRRERQKYYRAILEGFLLPFQGMLKTTSEVFARLRNDRDLQNLEYHPGRLQQYFASLPDEDSRKQLWRQHIEWLQTENRYAVELVERFYGQIARHEFRSACDEFTLHAKEWRIMWDALKGSGTIPASLDMSGQLYAPQFPAGLEAALNAEIAEVKRRSGAP